MNDLQERILIVDDQPANLLLIEKMLKSQGYSNLELIQDSRKVVSSFCRTLPDLILLDLNMPHLDGFQVMEQLSQLQEPLMPPVIFLTAQDSREHILKALSLGARDYITKPFDRNELLMRVRNLLDAQLAHRLLHDQKNVLEDLVKARTEELYLTRLQIIQRLGKAAEYKDEETGNHILRMSHVAAHIAKVSGWDQHACELLLNASPMHDIGKIGIPDAILLKPGKFTEEEWKVMQTHAEIGAKLLDGDDSDLMRMARDIALTHHERWNGSGYPNGLKGEEIPEAARIASLSDVFDALVSERPYKKAWSVDDAVALITSERGQQFEPRLVDIFLNELQEILQIRARFCD